MCAATALTKLGLEKIVADVDPANVASVRVLEKCGFEKIGGEGDKLRLRRHAVSSSPSSIKARCDVGRMKL